MEETEIGEVGVDKLNESAHEKAKEKKDRVPWLQWLALSTALFAVLAAIASLKSGQLANESLLSMNEATLKQAQASDAWSYYQAKGIKQVTRETEVDILSASHAPADTITKVRAEADRYRSEQQDIQNEARRLEQEQKELADKSRKDLERHHRFAYAVTVLQVAIGLSAIAALIERRGIWFIALLGGIAGVVFLLYSFV
jgi:lipopolysaccharide export LptBFGC system permease protein LptF